MRGNEYRTGQDIAAALRTLAARLDKLGDEELALTDLSVGLQVVQHGGATLEERTQTAVRLAGLLELDTYCEGGLLGTEHWRTVDGAHVTAYTAVPEEVAA